MKVRELRAFRREVGKVIQARRTSKNITLEELGDELGVSYQMVQHYEKGSKAMDMARFVEICQFLRMDAKRTLGIILKRMDGRNG